MSGANPRYANGAARRALRQWWRAQGLPCQVCGREIDYSLPTPHPMSFEVDEIVPVSRGGDPLSKENTGPAHRCCNLWKSDMTLDEAHAKLRSQGRRGLSIEHSGLWT